VAVGHGEFVEHSSLDQRRPANPGVPTKFGLGQSTAQASVSTLRRICSIYRLVAEDTRYVGSILSIRDGVMTALRIE
jgi:hypothetical protein